MSQPVMANLRRTILVRMRDLQIKSQAELAERCGLSDGAIWRVISGATVDPPASLLIALARGLEMDVGDFLRASLSSDIVPGPAHDGLLRLLELAERGRVCLTTTEMQRLHHHGACGAQTAEEALDLVMLWRTWRLRRRLGAE